MSAIASSSRLRLARPFASALRVASTRRYAQPANTPPPPPSLPSSKAYEVFDRNAKRMQKDRAAVNVERSRTVDYLRAEVAERLFERFEDLRNPPTRILDFSSGPGHMTKLLGNLESTEELQMVELSERALFRDADDDFDVIPGRSVIDEENLLSHVDENSQDCIVSNLGLHWINDLPGVLKQIQRALKPDGVFLGAMLGGDTLFELRTALQLAEQERDGGISPRVSPMADPSDASNLMGRAGFTLLTVDLEDLQISYPSMWELMEDLKDMGESGAVIGRKPFIKRDILMAADSIYRELHGHEDGSVPATFQVIYLIGWKPAPSQPKALPRGSGQTNLKDVLGGGDKL